MNTTAGELVDWALEHNLNEIVRFHNYVRTCLAERLRASTGNAVARSSLANYAQYLANNAFLMVYAYFEEYLYLTWRRLAASVSRGRCFSIKRYQPVLELLSVRLDTPAWRFMMKATDIRDCIIHGNGRVAHMSKLPRAQIEALVAEFPGELQIEHDRLKLNPGFTRRFVTEVRVLQKAVKKATDHGKRP